MKNPFLLLSLFLFLVACQNDSLDLVEVKDDSDNLLERYTWRKDTYAKQGKYEAFYPSGQPFEVSNYENDTLNGVRTVYFENGNIQLEEPYKMGKFVGVFKAYHDNGELELTGEFVDNAMQGLWKGYYDNGQLKEEVLFVDNQENGPFIEYHENGNLKAKGTYLNGDTEHGLLQEYNDAGVLIREANCEMGICRTTWRLEEEEIQQSN